MSKKALFLFFVSFSMVSFSQKLNTQEIDALIAKGIAMQNKGENDEAIKLFEESKTNSENIDYEKGLSNSYLGLSASFLNHYNSKKAIEYIFLAEKFSANDPEILSKIYTNKGHVLHIAGSYDEALKRYNLAIEFANKIPNKNLSDELKEAAQINISGLYIHLEKFQMANQYAYQSFASKDLSNKLISAINLAESFSVTNKLDSAKKYIDIIDSHLHNHSKKSKMISGGIQGVKGIYYVKNGDYQQAINELHQNASSTESYAKNELLAIAHSKLNNKDSALYYYQLNSADKLNKKFLILDNSSVTSILHNEEKQKMEENYIQQKRYYIGIIFLAIITLLTLIFLFYYKQKLMKQRTDLLYAEQEKLKVEHELAELKQEQFQKQILATSIQLEHKKKVLDNLKDNFKNDRNFNLKSYLNTEQSVDKDLNNIADIVKEVHPNFFNKLENLTDIKLSNLDIKYAAFIYMNLSNSQIASLLNVTPNTVNVTKFRLKQKLNLSKEIDLEVFLRSLK